MRKFVYFPLGIFLLFPLLAAGKGNEVIIGGGNLNPELEIVSDNPFRVARQDRDFLLSVSAGVTYLVYPIREQYDELKFSLGTDQKLILTVIPNIGSTAKYTYEFQQEVAPSSEIKNYRISLRHAYFRNAENFGIKIESHQNASLVLREVVLERFSIWQKAGQVFRDYFRAAPYTTSTVNVFPAPRISGRSAFLFLLPLFFILFFLLHPAKSRKIAAIALLALWLLTDFRMDYEFLSYQWQDRKTWVKPAPQERTLRNYGDFYAFAEWVKSNLPARTRVVNLYLFDNAHYYGILKYLLYPTLTQKEGSGGEIFVVYNRPDVKLGGGEILASFNDDSYLFIKK